MADKQLPLYYGDYLKLEKLLDCQTLESSRRGKTAHDEMLFVIVHQAYELWFKLILWELDGFISVFRQQTVKEEEVGRAVLFLKRIQEVQRVLINQIDVMETMTPLDFLEFRDYLVPASGFQSAQFRLIENKLGLRSEDRLRFSSEGYLARMSSADRKRVELSEKEPSAFDLVERWLERTPFVVFGQFDFWNAYRHSVNEMLDRDRHFVDSNPTLTDQDRAIQRRNLKNTEQRFAALFDRDLYTHLQSEGGFRMSHKALTAALLIHLYRDEPILHLPFLLLTSLVDIDEQFSNWRYRHALMARRMIGAKIGTGGSSGEHYLRDVALKIRIFEDLANLPTFFIPRSSLPILPQDVHATMGFRYRGGSQH